MQIIKPSISKRRRVFRLVVTITILALLGFWIWTRYAVIKTNWPFFKGQVERTKAILNNEINVLNRKIDPNFFGMKLFMQKNEFFKLIGEENTRPIEVEIPELSGVLVEHSMLDINYGYDFWDKKNGQGRMNRQLGFFEAYDPDSYGASSWKDNPWIQGPNSQIPRVEELQNISCYFFRDVLYKIQIEYGYYHDNFETRWRQFVEPTFRSYGFSLQCPDGTSNCNLSQQLHLNDGTTNLSFYRFHDYVHDADSYEVIYENNKVAKDVEEAKKAHFSGPKF